MNNQQPPEIPKQSLGCLPYALGGASFIPLLGVPLGIIAIIWGLVTKKKGKRALILLGAGGIVFTVLVYGSLFYFAFVQRGGLYAGLYKQLAQTSLQSLVKEIEFFKLQHGAYPARLDELLPTAKDSFISVYDLTQVHLGSTNAPLYFYELQPDKQHYYLRSVGPDQIPFTPDDILPQFTPEEMSKMGLLTHKK